MSSISGGFSGRALASSCTAVGRLKIADGSVEDLFDLLDLDLDLRVIEEFFKNPWRLEP